MAKAAQSEKVTIRARLKQIGMVVGITAKRDPKFVPVALAATLGPLIVVILLVTLAGLNWLFLPLGVLLAFLGFVTVLNIRSTKVGIAEAKGQPGAAISVIESIPRGDYRVKPAIASTTQFDVVHLLLFKGGVILIGEGNPARVRQLIGQEKRRLGKVIGSAEMRDMIIGDEEGQVPLEKLRSALIKMPTKLTGKDINALDIRLKALTAKPAMPKGAVPKSMRPQTGAFRAPRGR